MKVKNLMKMKNLMNKRDITKAKNIIISNLMQDDTIRAETSYQLVVE